MDWERIYGVKPIAFESFVDVERFKRTVYKAANWVFLGITEGKGRHRRYPYISPYFDALDYIPRSTVIE